MSKKTAFWLVMLMLALPANLFWVACEDSGDGADGTWTDSSSGLTWQVTPSYDDMTWEEVKSYCENLTLDGGGWRLPTISELRSLIRGCNRTMPSGGCEVTDHCLDLSCWNDSCLAPCIYLQGPGENGEYWPEEMVGSSWDQWYFERWFWSSSKVSGYDHRVWTVSFIWGVVEINLADDSNTSGAARCVRPSYN